MAEKVSEKPDETHDSEKEGAEKKLRELAKSYWLKYYLSHLGKKDEVETETAHEAYERYLERLENLGMLPSPRITEIIKEDQEEARQDARALVDEEERSRISELN